MDALDDRHFVDVVGQRQLHEDAVHGRIVVQLIDQAQDFLFRGVGRQVVVARFNAGVFAAAALVPDVDLRCRVAADQNDGQARSWNALLGARIDLLADLAPNIGGNFLSVYELSGHTDYRYAGGEQAGNIPERR